jgi:hypothetical protein
MKCTKLFILSIIIIIIIIIITHVITVVQGIYNYITVNHVSSVYRFAAVLCLQFVPHVMLFRPRFVMFSVIANIYNKKIPNAYAEPSTLLFSTSLLP